MALITETITFAPVDGFPAGSAVDHIVSTLTSTTDATKTYSANSAPAQSGVTFPDVDAGSYSTSVQAVAADGTPLGAAVTGTLTVAAPATVTLSIPSTASFAQS